MYFTPRQMKFFASTLFLFLLVISCKEAAPSAEIDMTEKLAIQSIKMEIQDTLAEVYTVPRFLPLFQGCYVESVIEKSYKCSKQRLAYFVSQNIHYPEAAEKVGLDDVCVVQFVIDENGIVQNEKILKSIGHGTDQIVLAMIKKMRDEIVWTPGTVKSEAVKVLHTLPIKFSIN